MTGFTPASPALRAPSMRALARLRRRGAHTLRKVVRGRLLTGPQPTFLSSLPIHCPPPNGPAAAKRSCPCARKAGRAQARVSSIRAKECMAEFALPSNLPRRAHPPVPAGLFWNAKTRDKLFTKLFPLPCRCLPGIATGAGTPCRGCFFPNGYFPWPAAHLAPTTGRLPVNSAGAFGLRPFPTGDQWLKS